MSEHLKFVQPKFDFIKEYKAFEMKEGESIKYIKKLLNLIAINIEGLGKIVPTGELNSKILESITKDFNNKVCVIEEANNVSEILTNELIGNLMVAEMVVARKKVNHIKLTLALKSMKFQKNLLRKMEMMKMLRFP
ncbi:hypothetical protein LIER_14875 [Lithospermum erythrorhizon]|uniref:Uncharacterized protein n=1 Tax=Lithospermum erythrorhizon TaxID=34254 RepID=A0AAV3Q0T2_LITER